MFCLKVDVLIKTQLRCEIAHFDHRLTRAAKNGEPGQRSNGDQVDQIDPALHGQAREGQGKIIDMVPQRLIYDNYPGWKKSIISLKHLLHQWLTIFGDWFGFPFSLQGISPLLDCLIMFDYFHRIYELHIQCIDPISAEGCIHHRWTLGSGCLLKQ